MKWGGLFAGTTTVLTVALVGAALVVGPGNVGLADALAVVVGGDGPNPLVHALVWDVRLPRALFVLLIGAALSLSGVVTQGLFRNPLAEPGVLGVSVGAATAAIVGFALGVDAWGVWATPLLAGAGGACVLVLLLLLTRRGGGFATLLLSGIAIGALCSAVSTFVLSLGAERSDLGAKVIRWLMGSFESRSWDHVAIAAPMLAVGFVLALTLRLELDALGLGESTAQSLGVDLRRTQWLALATVAMLAGMATALCGVIGFVGLVVPHIARMFVGAGHRQLLTGATILGALLLLVVDTGSRAVSIFALPPGALTSLLGAPFFLWLLRRMQGNPEAC